MEKEKAKATSWHALTPGQGLPEANGDMAHPCDNDSVVVIAHSLHHPHARDESQCDEGGGYAEKSYDNSKHGWATILRGWVEHDGWRHSCST